MKKLLVLFVFLAILIVACEKKNPVNYNYVTLSHKQTHCNDPWETHFTNDSLTLAKLADYLTKNNLFFAELNIKRETGGEICSACTCKTGNTIYVTTFDTDSLKIKYELIGFK